MGKCLVTKLNGVVDNSSILRIGEMRLYVDKVDSPNANTQGFAIAVNKPVTLKILSDGYFTNESLTNNLGTTITLDKSNPNVFVSNNNVEIAIWDKYSIISMTSYYTTGTGNYAKNKRFDIEGLKYSADLSELIYSNSQVFGNLENLSNLTKLVSLRIGNSNIEGDIKALSRLSSLTSIVLPISTYGDISAFAEISGLTMIDCTGSSISGDLKNLSNLLKLNTIKMYATNVNGDINSLSNLAELQYFYAPNTNGDVASLSGLNKLKEFSSANSSIIGDLSKVPSNCYLFEVANYKGNGFTWSSRPSSSNIFAIQGSPKIENIDKMLQDLAQCNAAIPSTGETFYKKISAIGTRTPASDAAVQTLQSKGYTVSIIPV